MLLVDARGTLRFFDLLSSNRVDGMNTCPLLSSFSYGWVDSTLVASVGGTFSSWVVEGLDPSAKKATSFIKVAEVALRSKLGTDFADGVEVEVIAEVKLFFSLAIKFDSAEVRISSKTCQFAQVSRKQRSTIIPKCLLVNHLPLQASQVALELALCPVFTFESLPFRVLLQGLRQRQTRQNLLALAMGQRAELFI